MVTEVRPEVKKVLDNWHGKIKYKILNIWEDMDTWYITVVIYHGDISFYRIFPSSHNNEYHISQDNTISLDSLNVKKSSLY